MAFHLHRLGLSGTALATSLNLPRAHALAVRQGRMSLLPADARWLSRQLQVEGEELARPLTPTESLEWAFYRVSARYPLAVWATARESWAPVMSTRSAADLMGMDYAHVKAVTSGRRRSPALQRVVAVPLAECLGLADGPESFLAGLPRHPTSR